MTMNHVPSFLSDWRDVLLSPTTPERNHFSVSVELESDSLCLGLLIRSTGKLHLLTGLEHICEVGVLAVHSSTSGMVNPFQVSSFGATLTE